MPAEAEKEVSLSVIDRPADPRRGRIRRIIVHVARLLVFAAILLLIRLQHQQRTADAVAQRNAPPVSLSQIKSIFPDVSSIGNWRSGGTAECLDRDQNKLGTLIHTANESIDVIGYVGSTYLLIVLDTNEVIRGVVILESEDTVEHVDAVQKHEFFLKSWNGLSWKSAAQKDGIDSVSGATLTSIAIVQSLRARLGSTRPSLKFPDPLDIREINRVFSSAEQFELANETEGWYVVSDSESRRLGYFFRSSPTADHVHGFQGPTDFLTFFDAAGKYLKTEIRSSFDNMKPEPFVDYVRQESYFLVEQFSGLSLGEIANYDELNVEGASGATMTSEGVFRAMKHSAQRILEAKDLAKESGDNKAAEGIAFNVSVRDYGTIGILLAALLMTFSKLKHFRVLRFLFQIVLVVYLGFLNGDILSQTVFIGWTQNGIPWNNALGFFVLTVAVLSVPIFYKRNLYCHSVCPFGAAQLLAGKLVRKKSKVPKRLNKVLKVIPAILIGLAMVVGLFGVSFNLASIEPFDAFSFWIAGWAALSIAVVGLLSSVFVPMAYCKYGCPTGGILEYLRRTGRSDRIGLRDYFALLLLGIALFAICI